MFLAVIVELTDSHFRNLVLSCISPYPFGIDLIFLCNLLGSVILGDVKVVFCYQPFIRFAFKHEFDVGFPYQRHLSAEPGCTEFLFLYQFVDVLAAYTHQTCCLRKGEVFLLFQRRAQFLHLLHMAQLHLPLHHAVFVTPFRALRAAITSSCFLCDERFSAPLTNSFYFHIFVLFSAILHEF